MDDNQGMDSFVDIVANTLGMVVLLTILTVAHVDKRGLVLNVDLKEKLDQFNERENDIRTLSDTILSTSAQLAASGADAGLSEIRLPPSAEEDPVKKAEVLLARLDDIIASRDKIQADLDLVKRSRAVAESRRNEQKQGLESLRAKKLRFTTAIKRREEVKAKLVSDLPGLDVNEFEDTPLTALRTQVGELETEIKDYEERAKIGKAEYDELGKRAADLEARERVVAAELARYRAATDLVIEVSSPSATRDLTRMPVFVECFVESPAAGGPDEPRVRFVAPGGPGAQAEGDGYLALADPQSAFRTFLAGQDAGFKRSHQLHFIVRPGACAAFREARDVARKEGWTVNWNPVEKDAEIKIGEVAMR